MLDLRRRQFITLFGGAAAAWPLAARAQAPKMPVIGFVNGQRPREFAHLVTAFHQGLGETGYVEGQIVAIEYRWAEGQETRVSTLIEDLVRLPVAVVVITGSGQGARLRWSAILSSTASEVCWSRCRPATQCHRCPRRASLLRMAA